MKERGRETEGVMDGWMGGWMDGEMNGMDVTRTAMTVERMKKWKANVWRELRK